MNIPIHLKFALYLTDHSGMKTSKPSIEYHTAWWLLFTTNINVALVIINLTKLSHLEKEKKNLLGWVVRWAGGGFLGILEYFSQLTGN